LLQLKHRHHELILFTTADYMVNLFLMISDQIRMESKLKQQENLWSSGNESSEEENDGLGIWRMCFTPSQCQELKPYYFQWMNRLQRQAVEWRISSEKESNRKTERTHEKKKLPGGNRLFKCTLCSALHAMNKCTTSCDAKVYYYYSLCVWVCLWCISWNLSYKKHT